MGTKGVYLSIASQNAAALDPCLHLLIQCVLPDVVNDGHGHDLVVAINTHLHHTCAASVNTTMMMIMMLIHVPAYSVGGPDVMKKPLQTGQHHNVWQHDMAMMCDKCASCQYAAGHFQADGSCRT
jgi:hypothetical protein